jgi:hypothetical protein
MHTTEDSEQSWNRDFQIKPPTLSGKNITGPIDGLSPNHIQDKKSMQRQKISYKSPRLKNIVKS